MNTAYANDKALWHREKIEELRAGRQIVPAQIQLILSDLCNQDCHFCHPATVLIDTPNRKRYISDLRVGDEVLIGGSTARVTRTGQREVSEYLKIEYHGGTLEVTGEHPVYTQRGFVAASAVSSGDWLATPLPLRLRQSDSSDDSWEEMGVESLPAAPSVYREEEQRSSESSRKTPHDNGQSHVGHEGSQASSRRPKRMSTVSGGTGQYLRCCEASDEHGQPDPRPELSASHQNDEPVGGLAGQPYQALRMEVDGLQVDSGRQVLPRFYDGNTPVGIDVFLDRFGPSAPVIRIPQDRELRSAGVQMFSPLRYGPQEPEADGWRVEGDTLFREDTPICGLSWRQVDSILRVRGRTTVYSIEVDPGHAYVADGVVVHNCSYRMSGGISTEQFRDSAGNKNPNRIITYNKALSILMDASSLGVKAIQFTGGGEPTVHPDHMDLFRATLDLGMQAALVTNGVLLREGWKNVLPGFSWIRVSLDAGSEDSYSTIRSVPRGTFQKVMRHIHMLATEIKEAESDCLLGVGFVITPENFKEIERATELIRGTGAEYVRLSAMFSDNYSAPYLAIQDEIRERISRAKGYETERFKVVDLFGDRLSDLAQHAPDYDFCGYQEFNMYIGGNLKVYRCCSTSYTKHGEVGDLAEQSFGEWFASEQKRSAYADFKASSCRLCQFNTKNRNIIKAIKSPPREASPFGNPPQHVNFV